MKNKLFAVAAALTAAVTSFAAQAAEELRVGTHPTFAPFEFMDTHTREYVGFDMDLIREIGKRAGYDVKIVNMGFDGLIPALFSGTIDIAASPSRKSARRRLTSVILTIRQVRAFWSARNRPVPTRT